MGVDDEALTRLKLPLNATLLENKELDEGEEAMMSGDIVPEISNAKNIMDTFDETSRIRIFRGMITNNKGTEKERISEAIATFQRIGEWRLEHPDVMIKGLKGEDVLHEAMNSAVGGFDKYGHLIWGERLGDIVKVVEYPLTPDEAKAVRMKCMEGIRLLQARASKERGPRRYKQVYVIDLAEVSLGTLMTRPKVREMTIAIMGAANAFFPETMWKCFVLNAPFVFRSVWTIISPFIHPVTKEKIKILGGPSKYLPEMEAAGIDLDAIPEIFNGTKPLLTLKDAIASLAPPN
ncbi:hypothetical protein CTAYLR_004478 [Chrysophaeum taylorii]|uniref:CRAL-TRIO domain-containing protein n=1 Tax=Chrysophaeum taylorii TaxID=2483200 RepID=A0AAD7U921_9STRA|nr:hypothetical protein CTAYLR_004426 [Chrysophaeum taylorii]KAJ8613637.1 hypothetical protein CTAYLR_004478 [Chrysophaeum taylorii]